MYFSPSAMVEQSATDKRLPRSCNSRDRRITGSSSMTITFSIAMRYVTSPDEERPGADPEHCQNNKSYRYWPQLFLGPGWKGWPFSISVAEGFALLRLSTKL